MKLASTMILVFALAGCAPPPWKDVHPEGEDLSDHEMFDWIVGRCLEAQDHLYAIGNSYSAQVGGSGYLTKTNHNGGLASPDDFVPGMRISDNSVVEGHYPPGTHFVVDAVIKKENPLDSPSYYFLTTMPLPDGSTMRLSLLPLLGPGAKPVNPLTPKERIAAGEEPLDEAIRFCPGPPANTGS